MKPLHIRTPLPLILYTCHITLVAFKPVKSVLPGGHQLQRHFFLPFTSVYWTIFVHFHMSPIGGKPGRGASAFITTAAATTAVAPNTNVVTELAFPYLVPVSSGGVGDDMLGGGSTAMSLKQNKGNKKIQLKKEERVAVETKRTEELHEHRVASSAAVAESASVTVSAATAVVAVTRFHYCHQRLRHNQHHHQ